MQKNKNLTIILSKVWVGGLKKSQDGKVIYLKKDGKENSVVSLRCHISDEKPENKDLSEPFWFDVPVKTGTLLSLKEKGLDISEGHKKPLDILVSLSQAVMQIDDKHTKVYYKPSRLITVYESNKDSRKQELNYTRKIKGEYNPLVTIRGLVYFGKQNKKDGSEVRLNEHTGLIRFVCNPSSTEKEAIPELEATWLSISLNDNNKEILDNLENHAFTNVVCRMYHTTVKEGEYENKYFAFSDLQEISKIVAKPKETASIDQVAIDDSDLPF